MADITIADLLAIEPGLRLVAPRDPAAADGIEVGWVVAARTTTPMLPSLRGGEFVFFGEAAATAAAVPWPAMLADLARLGAGGVIVPPTIVVPFRGLPVLSFDGGGSPGEVEGTLNRALTEFRGDLYRAGADLGRVLGVLAAAGADPARIVREAAATLGLPVSFASAAGMLAATDPRPNPSALPTWTEVPIRDGLTVAVGWSDPRRGALARMASERLAEALGAAVRRTDAERPRGPARARGLERFLFGAAPLEEHRARSEALALGLSPAAEYRVLIAPTTAGSDIVRAVSPLALAIEAGSIDGDDAWVLEGRSPRPNWTVIIDRIADAVRSELGPDAGWAALSSPLQGFEGLRPAADEARSVASLLRSGRLAVRVAAYGDGRALGAWQLLLPVRGELLRSFAADTLRDLAARDRRGELRRTLEVFLDSGGASVEAARLLNIHRNTLAYRLRRVAALTGLDPLDPATRLSLQLALMAWRLDDDAG